jgi:hypothetical protein
LSLTLVALQNGEAGAVGGGLTCGGTIRASRLREFELVDGG